MGSRRNWSTLFLCIGSDLLTNHVTDPCSCGLQFKIYIFHMSEYQATFPTDRVLFVFTVWVSWSAKHWASLLTLRLPAVGTFMMDKGGFMKAIYECLLMEDPRTDETAWSIMLEFGIK